MGSMIGDRVLETTHSTGTGPLTLLGPSAQCRGFLAAYPYSTLVIPYTLVAGDGIGFELGRGSLNGNILTRAEVFYSSNNNLPIDLPVGTHHVFSSVSGRDLQEMTFTSQPVVSYQLDAPPSTELYQAVLVGSAGTGAFDGKSHHIAIRNATQWHFIAPKDGWLVHVLSPRKTLRFNAPSNLWEEQTTGTGSGSGNGSGGPVTVTENRPVGRKIGILGTSLVSGNTAASTSPKISTWSKGWMTWAKILGPDIEYTNWQVPTDAYGRTWAGANHGVGGQKSIEIIERLPEILAVKPDYVIVDNGTNEMSPDLITTIIENTQTIYDTLRNAGIKLIILPVLARGVIAWASSSDMRKKAHAVNQWKKAYAQKYGCFYFDWNKPWVDWSNANGEPCAGFTEDGTHFLPRGAFAVGKELAAYLSTIFPPRQPDIISQDDKYDATFNTTGNAFPNPNMLGTGGVLSTGAQGVVANDLRVERNAGTSTVTCSIESRGVKGNWQVLTFTPTGSGTSRFHLRTSSSDMAHSFPAGTWVQASCDIEVSAYEGWRSHQLYLKDQGVGGMYSYACEEYESGLIHLQTNEAWKGRLTTEPFPIVAGSTLFRNRLEVAIDDAVAPGANPAQIKVGAWAFRPVTDPRTIWS